MNWRYWRIFRWLWAIQTEAEKRARIMPANPQFPPGDPRRYGATATEADESPSAAESSSPRNENT